MAERLNAVYPIQFSLTFVFIVVTGFPSLDLPGLGLWGLYFSLSLIEDYLILNLAFPGSGVGLFGLLKHEVHGFSFPLLCLSGLGLRTSVFLAFR